MDAYLDNNVVSGLVNQDLEEEQDAASALLTMHERGEVRLFTSRVTIEEISRAPIYRQAGKLAMVGRISKLPDIEEVVDFPGSLLMQVVSRQTGQRFVVSDSILEQLSKALPHRDDARHLFHAIRAGVGYFITVDARTILRHEEILRQRFGVIALRPSTFLAQLPRRTS